MKLILISAGVLLIISTLLSVSRNEKWWVRIFDFPRLQILFLLVVIMVMYPLAVNLNSFHDIIFYAVLSCSFLYQLKKIHPYTIFASVESESCKDFSRESKISVLVANILMTNKKTDSFVELVRKYEPDLLCILEPDEYWERELSELYCTYAYGIRHPRNDTYGMIVLSKLELVEPQLRFMVEDNVPSVHTKVKLMSGDIIELYCLHPSPPNPRYAKETTERDAELIIVGRECVKSDYACIVTGDLNDVAWSYTTELFQKVSKLLDPRKGRGFFNTFHAKIPFVSFPLDHMFHSVSFRLVKFEKTDKIGSDHFPIYVELSYHDKNKQPYNGPTPNEDDLENAGDKVDQAT